MARRAPKKRVREREKRAQDSLLARWRLRASRVIISGTHLCSTCCWAAQGSDPRKRSRGRENVGCCSVASEECLLLALASKRHFGKQSCPLVWEESQQGQYKAIMQVSVARTHTLRHKTIAKRASLLRRLKRA